MEKEELLKNAYDLLCEFTTPKARFPMYFLLMFDGDEKVTEALIFGKDKLLEDTSKMQYVMDFYAQKCDEFENKVTMLAQALGCSAYNLFFACHKRRRLYRRYRKHLVREVGSIKAGRRCGADMCRRRVKRSYDEEGLGRDKAHEIGRLTFKPAYVCRRFWGR